MATTCIELRTLLLSMLAISIIEILAAGIAANVAVGGLVITGGARLAELTAMSAILIRGNGGLGAIGLSKATAWQGFRRGFFWSIGFGLLSLGAGLVLFITGMNPLSFFGAAPATTSSQIFLWFLIGAVIGPVAEEFFFRGVLYGYFRRWGFLPALILSTLFFVLMHPVRPLALTQTVGGIVFALAYERERNLMVPILIHVLGNTALFTLAFLV